MSSLLRRTFIMSCHQKLTMSKGMLCKISRIIIFNKLISEGPVHCRHPVLSLVLPATEPHPTGGLQAHSFDFRRNQQCMIYDQIMIIHKMICRPPAPFVPTLPPATPDVPEDLGTSEPGLSCPICLDTKNQVRP